MYAMPEYLSMWKFTMEMLLIRHCIKLVAVRMQAPHRQTDGSNVSLLTARTAPLGPRYTKLVKW